MCEDLTRYEYNDMIYIHNFYKLEACQKNGKSKFLLFIASSVLSFIFQTFFFYIFKSSLSPVIPLRESDKISALLCIALILIFYHFN